MAAEAMALNNGGITVASAQERRRRASEICRMRD